MKLTGHESSVLAFLAQRPTQLEEFRGSLGQDALLVARYLAGELKSPPTEAKETGDAIRAWATEREAREGEASAKTRRTACTGGKETRMSKPKKKPRRQKETFVERRALGLTIAGAGMYMLYRVTYLREEGDVHVYFDRIEYGHRVSYHWTPDANDKQVRPDLATSMQACSLLTEDLKRACIEADRALGLLEGGEKDGARSRR